MKAVVWHGEGDIRLDTVPDKKIEQSTDAVIRITRSAICGTDLHMVRGTMPGMVPGTILGHEAVGIVEAVGNDVRNFTPGGRGAARLRDLLLLPGRLLRPVRPGEPERAGCRHVVLRRPAADRTLRRAP